MCGVSHKQMWQRKTGKGHLLVEGKTLADTQTVKATSTTCGSAPAVLIVIAKKATKRVSFSRSVEVLLVPCLAEYRSADVMDSVWWSAIEMKQFRVETGHSVQRCMTRFSTLDSRQALKVVVIDPEAYMFEDKQGPQTILEMAA